ncbi:MAG: anthranilate phosphoribosyltransferase [Rhodospirillaceae bacterium]|nr:anthranilate phosphoribosyltransferase [Rhodospirillaceae bacterium]
MMNEILEKIAHREDLTAAEMTSAVGAFVDNECEPAQVAGFLMALRVKGETVDELVGAAVAFRERAVHLPETAQPVLCTAGTGGDRFGSINLSTAAALIAAATGVPVAKHGNRSVSSRCGSADVLDALDIPTGLSPQDAVAAIRDNNFSFLFAPHYHPAMKSVAPVRKALAVSTLFNLLGPLTNPARVPAQVVGVSHPSRIRFMAAALLRLGIRRALVISAENGLDEIAPEGVTHMVELREGTLTDLAVTPADFGLAEAPLETVRGGDPMLNAAIIRTVLNGKSHEARTGVLLNAAAALYIAGKASSLGKGAEIAIDTIESGRAADTLDRLSCRPEEQAVAA